MNENTPESSEYQKDSNADRPDGNSPPQAVYLDIPAVDPQPQAATPAPPPLPRAIPVNNTQPPPQPQPQTPSPKKESFASSCLRGCMMVSFVFMVIMLGLILISFVGCFAAIKTGEQVMKAEYAKIAGQRQHAHNGRNAVVITISGMITDESGSSAWYVDETSSTAALDKIRAATKDSTISGILLNINSGGGGITASDIIWDALVKFKQAQEGRVVVVMMGTTAASGAYYIAVAGDSIVANPTTLTGSIGVIMQSVNVKSLAEKIGIRDVTIKSGDNKAILSPFEDLTPEQRAMLQKMVDSLHTRFVQVVAEGRGIDEARVRAIADGRILLASEALEYGLIDKVGYIEDAKAEMETLLGGKVTYLEGSQVPPIFRMLRSPSFWGECMSEAMIRTQAEMANDTGIEIK